MRKALFFLISMLMLGIMMGGCVSPFGKTTIRYEDVNKYYLGKLENKKKVGNENIKFYVKVIDKRKDKRMAEKRGGIIPIVQGSLEMKDEKFLIATKNTVQKALLNTGWGIANKKEANYTMNIAVNDFSYHFWKSVRIVDANMCILDNDNRTVIKKDVNHKTFFVFAPFTHHGAYIAGSLFKDFYESLIQLFSSPSFVKAIKENYYRTHHLGNTTLN